MAAKKKDGMSFKLRSAPPAKTAEKAKDEQNVKDRKAVAAAAPAKKSASVPPAELKGEELDKAVKKADVEGRSQMTADEKREAVAEASKPKKKEPTVVKDLEVTAADAHAVLSVNGTEFRLEPTQVAYLTKNLTHINNDLHVHSNA